jgi:hypothetical protein
MTRTTLDGYAVFAAIGSHPDLFAGAEQLVIQNAQKILLATLKKHADTNAKLAAVRSAVGSSSFGLALDMLGASDLKKLLKANDPHCAKLATGSPDDHRAQLDALAAGAVAPSPKPEKPIRPPKAKKSPKSEEAASWPTSMGGKPPQK